MKKIKIKFSTLVEAEFEGEIEVTSEEFNSLQKMNDKNIGIDIFDEQYSIISKSVEPNELKIECLEGIENFKILQEEK